MNITEKSTKAQILKAYEEAMAQLKAVSRTTVADEQEAKRVTGVVANAEAIVEMGILNPEITAQYKDLQEAIKLAKAELEELFNIKAEALSLEAIVNAKTDKVAELDAQIKDKEAEHKARITAVDTEFDIIVNNINKEIDERRKALEKERRREQEEYAYNLKRERQKENDAWEDEKAEREKELALREEAVEAREDAMRLQEKDIVILKNQVAEIPARIAQEVDKAVSEAKSKFEKSKAIEKSHMTREHEWQVQSLEDKIATLQAQVKSEAEARQLAEAKLENAYTQMRELATTTVQSSAVKVIETQKAV